MKYYLCLLVFSFASHAQPDCKTLQKQFNREKGLFKVFDTTPSKPDLVLSKGNWKQLNWKGKRIPLPAGEVKKINNGDSFFYMTKDEVILLVNKHPNLKGSVEDYKYQYSIMPEKYNCDPKIGNALVLKSIKHPGVISAVYKDLNQLDAVTKKMIFKKKVSLETYVNEGANTWLITYTFPSEDSYNKNLIHFLNLGMKYDSSKASGDTKAQKAFENYLNK